MRGKFTDRSSATSAEIFASLHLGALALGAAVALTAFGGPAGVCDNRYMLTLAAGHVIGNANSVRHLR